MIILKSGHRYNKDPFMLLIRRSHERVQVCLLDVNGHRHSDLLSFRAIDNKKKTSNKKRKR